MKFNWLTISILMLFSVTNKAYSDNKDIINTFFYAKETISIISDSKSSKTNDKIYKGISFIIKNENILKREKNRLLVKNLNVSKYPYDYIINGWLNLDKLATKADAIKTTNWPFKTWKTYMLTVQMDVYEFTKKGEVTAYTLLDIPSEDIDKNHGHVYLIGDIALMKHTDTDSEGYFEEFAIYDINNKRLCPLGEDFDKCDKYLNADKKYNEFYLETY